MIYTYDVGSVPNGDLKSDVIVRAFVDKVKCGIDIPNYPQTRDMISMFLEMLTGLEKVEDRYVAIDKLGVKDEVIPEVKFLWENIKYIYELIGKEVKIKVCITGPYTLSQIFAYRYPDLFLELADALTSIIRANIFKSKYGGVEVLTIDEPSFSLLNDPLIDLGTEGRESLLKAWEKIFKEGVNKNAITTIHLHATSDPLFWDIKSLNVIESHVDDYIYISPESRRSLEKHDKFIKASICKTNFDELIKDKYANKELTPQEIADVWRKIKKGEKDPTIYLEDINIMIKRLRKIIDIIGEDRVTYAGPECGLYGFPAYNVALEYLKRVAEATKTINKELKKDMS